MDVLLALVAPVGFVGSLFWLIHACHQRRFVWILYAALWACASGLYSISLLTEERNGVLASVAAVVALVAMGLHLVDEMVFAFMCLILRDWLFVVGGVMMATGIASLMLGFFNVIPSGAMEVAPWLVVLATLLKSKARAKRLRQSGQRQMETDMARQYGLADDDRATGDANSNTDEARLERIAEIQRSGQRAIEL